MPELVARSEFRVAAEIDCFAAARGVRGVAPRLGFNTAAVDELVVVVSELASNILKYGVRGAINVEGVNQEPQGAGIRIDARDEGPPFHDLVSALRDGWNDRGPLDPDRRPRHRGCGNGLGAVVRFTDSFACADDPGGKGKCITVVRYVRRPKSKR
jgi:anti-sigma regulatory factor (Ser/Thr protein kinase)